MELITKGNYENFAAYIEYTGNTICGRYSPICVVDGSHPIGVLMCALTELRNRGLTGKWEFIRYEQSSQVKDSSDSSVSYVSAYWAPTAQEK
jgi:MEMO1 family protein